ncbi:CU044_5270 family protein [Kitasatospora sp. NPDC048365]|uniref:CU044_5270 family protein n=1 Tax=Kitasatospora sp. NPDC048365 TaxID=3364050 RepID=UPI003717052B
MNDTPEMLTADRHRLLKEHLMNEIDREAQAPHAPRARRKLVWLVASPIAVGAVAAAVLLVPGRPGAQPAPVGPAASGSASPSGSASASATASATPEPEPTDAAGLLARAARAIAAKPAPAAAAAQFTYTREVSEGGGWPRHERKIWWSVDGRSEGAMIDPTSNVPGKGEKGLHDIPARLPKENGVFAEPRLGGGRTTYQFVASLPTDPEQLRQRLLAVDRSDQVSPPSALTETMRNQLAFGDVQFIFQNVQAPPAVAGALMQAAARIPGTSVVADQVDAAGRKGVAVVGMSSNQRIALIFDVKTGQYLGLRIVESKYLPAVGPDGTPPVGEPGADVVKADPHAVFATAAMEERIVNAVGAEG